MLVLEIFPRKRSDDPDKPMDEPIRGPTFGATISRCRVFLLAVRLGPVRLGEKDSRWQGFRQGSKRSHGRPLPERRPIGSAGVVTPRRLRLLAARRSFRVLVACFGLPFRTSGFAVLSWQRQLRAGLWPARSRCTRGPAGNPRGTELGPRSIRRGRFLMRTDDGIVSGIRCRSRLRAQGPQTPKPEGFGRRGPICFVAHARRMPQYAFACGRLTSGPTALRTQPTGVSGRASLGLANVNSLNVAESPQLVSQLVAQLFALRFGK